MCIGNSLKDDAKSVVDEVELYSCLLVLIYLLDQKRYDEVRDLADSLVIRIGSASGQRRSLDPLNAKVYYYHRWTISVVIKFNFKIKFLKSCIRIDRLPGWRPACLHETPTQFRSSRRDRVGVSFAQSSIAQFFAPQPLWASRKAHF